ncbi:spliceosomal U5 snRNP-specific like protein [Spraguea lophii 42_110]|uniref:Spliceosomal U5 snRNP-specific like protein n=1 Tax=Spraguea lophii (strain 42_110) TaxID=1358809 RepID=S7WAC9_SPRLO|nr:spliceosomal U5 snRNP-specific like protein [Spraguea lophii 42_110]
MAIPTIPISKIYSLINSNKDNLVVLLLSYESSNDTIMYLILNDLYKKLYKFTSIYFTQIDEDSNLNFISKDFYLENDFGICLFFKGKIVKMDYGTGNNMVIDFYAEKEDLEKYIMCAYKCGVKGKSNTLMYRQYKEKY